MNIKKILGIVVGIAVIGTAIYFNQPEQSATGKKKVYAILPITGGLSFQGKEEKKTMEVWMQNHPNADFELEILDNESTPTKSLNIAQQIAMRDKNPVFICPIGAMCHPIVPQLKAMNGFMILSPSTQKEDGTYKEFQRISFGAEDMNKPLIDAVKSGETMVIICANTEAAHSAATYVANEVEKKGGKLLKKMTFEPQDLDTRITVLKALTLKPDAIFITGVPSMGYINTIKEIKTQGFQGKVLCDPTLRTPSVIAQLGKNADGSYTSVMPTERIYTEYPQIAKALEENGLELYNFPINVWDIMDVVSHFITNKITFNQNEFMKIGKWHGISSDIVFTENGNSAYEFELSVAKDGKFEKTGK